MLSSEPGAGGAARFGVGRWDAPEHGPCTDMALAVPWREQGPPRAALCGAEPPLRVFQPEASDVPSQRLHPAVAAPGSGVAVQVLGLSPGATSSSSLFTFPATASLQSHVSAIPNPAPAALPWARLLGMPMFWGMQGRVLPSSGWARQCWCGGDAAGVEPAFSRGPRRQGRGQLTHLCCHGEFSPRRRETVAFPQNLTGSVWMLGFSWKWDGMGEHWAVPAR